MNGTKFYVVAVGTLLVVGCTDKAESDFKVCTQLAADGQYGAAKTACEKAVASDPSSRSGEAAKKKLDEMQPALAKLAKEDEEKAAAKKAAEEAKKRADEEARVEAVKKCSNWCVLAGPGVGMHCSGGGGEFGLKRCLEFEELYSSSPGVLKPCHCND
jgi:hypothetical protein